MHAVFVADFGAVRCQHVMTSEQERISVPQELVDNIIDEIYDSRDDLKACSLVCWAWLPRSRFHLHRTVTLYHQNCRIHPSQTTKISMLLSLPMIAQYTQELLLEGKTDYGLHHPNKQSDIDNGELFWRALARFAHVKKLRITRLFWVSHSLENKNRLCAAFPSVTDLNVYMSDFADAKEFLSFLTAFPQLTRLRVERVFWAKSAAEWYEASGSDPSSYRALPPDRVPGAMLGHLQVQHCDVLMMTDIAAWLVSLPSPRIETLQLSPPDGDDFEALPLYFSTIGTNLKHLTLALEFSIKEDTLRRGTRSNYRSICLYQLSASSCGWFRSQYSVTVFDSLGQLWVRTQIRKGSLRILALCHGHPHRDCNGPSPYSTV